MEKKSKLTLITEIGEIPAEKLLNLINEYDVVKETENGYGVYPIWNENICIKDGFKEMCEAHSFYSKLIRFIDTNINVSDVFDVNDIIEHPEIYKSR